jgi:hypothetical protein
VLSHITSEMSCDVLGPNGRIVCGKLADGHSGGLCRPGAVEHGSDGVGGVARPATDEVVTGCASRLRREPAIPAAPVGNWQL